MTSLQSSARSAHADHQTSTVPRKLPPPRSRGRSSFNHASHFVDVPPHADPSLQLRRR